MTSGTLSAIHEEPNNLMSTTRDGASAAEMADNSRLSHLTQQDSSGMLVKDFTVCAEQKYNANQYISAARNLQEKALADRLVQQEQHEFVNPAESLQLPPSTKKYTLYLDLDETLIHSQQ